MLNNMEKVCIILKGVSGCGKTTVAEYISRFIDPNSSIICCADDYHMVNGEYKWTLENQGYAHRMCQDKCDQLMRMESSTVIVANTNTSKKEWQPYADMAEKYGYTVFHLVIENHHNGKDLHNVPEESLIRMEQKLKTSLKLR